MPVAPDDRPFQPELSLAANLRRIATLTAGWPGEPIDGGGAVRLANPGGREVPLFWCFNGGREFPLLAAAMGRARPLVGMRSLSGIISIRHHGTRPVTELARHYADSLLARFGPGPCIVGGNCEGAGVACRIALHLARAGVAVARLVTLDAEIRRPMALPLHQIFGRDSPGFNPFLNGGRDPVHHWQSAYAAVRWTILPAAHGAYFDAETVDLLAQAIAAPCAAPPVPAMQAPVPSPRWQIASVDGDGVTVTAPAPPGWGAAAGLAVVPQWEDRAGETLPVGGDHWVFDLAPGPVWTLRVPLPERGAPAGLRLVLCRAGTGPMGGLDAAEGRLDLTSAPGFHNVNAS